MFKFLTAGREFNKMAMILNQSNILLKEITLNEKLLEHSKITEKVLFVGQGKTFQMWEPALFKKFSDDARKKANLKRSELKWKQSN